MSIYADEDSCLAAGVDPKKVDALAKKLSRLASEVEAMGLYIFGGSGSGSLRTVKTYEHGQIVVANLDVNIWDGGDGGVRIFNGVQYGE